MIQAEMKRRRGNLLLYLLLNVLVSAGTILAVLYVWDSMRPTIVAPPLPAGEVVVPAQAAPEEAVAPLPTPTLPPTDSPVIEIRSVFGVGDLPQEAVLLQRLGEGNLLMTGWRLEGEQGNVFVFPAQPELILFKDGAVQIFTRPGDDTATEVYWDRTEPAWQRGETVRLFDTLGNERASYAIP